MVFHWLPLAREAAAASQRMFPNSTSTSTGRETAESLSTGVSKIDAAQSCPHERGRATSEVEPDRILVATCPATKQGHAFKDSHTMPSGSFEGITILRSMYSHTLFVFFNETNVPQMQLAQGRADSVVQFEHSGDSCVFAKSLLLTRCSLGPVALRQAARCPRQEVRANDDCEGRNDSQAQSQLPAPGVDVLSTKIHY